MALSNEELIELGKKVAARMETDKLKAQAANSALKRFKALHAKEWEKILSEERAKLGIE